MQQTWSFLYYFVQLVVGWQCGVVVASFVASMNPVSTGMGDCLQAGIRPRYVNKPTRSTQPCIPPELPNRVPVLID